jgi:acylphosphatase
LRDATGYGFILAVRPVKGLIFLPGIGQLYHMDASGSVNRKRMHIFYSGSVQGVGFRYTVKSVAAGFDVAGTVRNLSDGRVELVTEGVKDELTAFRQAIRDSGLDHFIRDEAVSWSEATGGLRGFEIVR